MENNLIEIGQTLSSAINQLSFISALIGGFAIALVTGIMNGEKSKISNITISILSTVSLLQISCTMFFSLVSFKFLTLSANNKSESFKQLLQGVETALGMFGVVFFISVLLFIIGIGISGWIRSKTVEFFTTSVAVVSFILAVYGILIVR